MELPPDKETMRSFLGMITHMENFQRLKMEISNMEALPYFNTSAETTLQTNASKKGLGACLMQNGKVVCYASRALTKTEQNY